MEKKKQKKVLLNANSFPEIMANKKKTKNYSLIGSP
jgi:hypothetical protein